MSTAPECTLSLYRFVGGTQKWWAFTRMQLAHASLKKIPQLKWYKLLGTGGGRGFSIKPDFSVYALLGVWDNSDAFTAYHKSHPLGAEYQKRSAARVHIHLAPIKSKGSWGGDNPYAAMETPADPGMPSAILTRARIRLKRLREFWHAVPLVSRNMSKRALYYKGIGEFPLFEQATFSLWPSMYDMESFAYGEKNHLQAISHTRKRDWYSEELFCRFKIVKISGEVQAFFDEETYAAIRNAGLLR